MKLILFLGFLSTVWCTMLDDVLNSGKNGVSLFLSSSGSSKVIEVRVPVDGKREVNIIEPSTETKTDFVQQTTVKPTPDNLSGLSDRIMYASHEDYSSGLKTIDLSNLKFTGDDLKDVLHMLNDSTRLTLGRLYVEDNCITDLPKFVFPVELEYSLKELRLDGNRLNLNHQLDSRGTRFELSRLRNLKILSLARCHLTTLDNLELPPIDTLELRDNHLVALPYSFEYLTSLHKLDLSCNKFRYLDSSPISSFKSMLSLNLSYNGMEKIEDEPLEHFYVLRDLQLDHNLLRHPPKLYKYLGSNQPELRISMSNNLFQCGCSFTETLKIKRFRVVDNYNLTCMDKNGKKWFANTREANICTPTSDAVLKQLEKVKDWLISLLPDLGTLYRSVGWLLFGGTLGLICIHHRTKKFPPARKLPYSTLEQA